MSFDKEQAIGQLYNVDDPNDNLLFISPMRELDYAKIKGMNALQGLGSEQTYQRRYLYLSVLDIVENDAIDGTSGKPDPDKPEAPAKDVAKATAPKKPATANEREEVKKELTGVDGDADTQQVNGIIRALKKLREKDGEKYEEYIAEVKSKIPSKSNPDRKISKTAADDLLIEIRSKLEE